MNRNADQRREDMWRGGAFVLALLGMVAALWAEQPEQERWTREALVDAFIEAPVAPREGRFIIVTGELPELEWERPFLVRELWGHVPLKVRWFDAAGEPTQRATEPGRYAAYVEGRVEGGPTIRRGLTFYAMDQEKLAAAIFSQDPETRWPPDMPLPGVSERAAAAYREPINDLMRRGLIQGVIAQEEAAILVAGLADWDAELEAGTLAEPPLDDPYVRHQEHQLAIKRELLDAVERYPAFDRPRRAEAAAPALAEGVRETPGFDAAWAERVRQVCREWYDEVGEGFTAVVARNGHVVFHEAFGQHNDEPVGRDTSYRLFSLSKTVTGVMVAAFVDQGLLELDEPLGHVFSDWPTEGPKALTTRQLMMHLSGLDGHAEWGALNNPWLENVVANRLETLEPGYQYSGVAYDVMGSAMALVSGKSVPRLFDEHLFEPLEMKNAKVQDLGIGIYLRAIDLARVGQVVLNEGRYGEQVFYGPEASAELMPQRYADLFPELERDLDDYGLGIRWAVERHPHAGEGEVPADATILSERTVGHGSFSGCVLRVDLENDLVVAVGRHRRGDDHGAFVRRLLMAVAEGLGASESGGGD